MTNPKPTASLSLDLDNLWSYMKTHGDRGWEDFPTYLHRLAPRVSSWLAERGLRITFFIVGLDASLPVNREPLARLAAEGHEIGNHSFKHEPWMQNAPVDELVGELERASDAIADATGKRPSGFRGPGFANSPALLTALCRLGFDYDASTLPSLLGPVARLYYLSTARLDSAGRRQRAGLFGKLSDGFRPLHPYQWETPAGRILEIPVTTVPLLRAPFHLSYILWLSGFSKAAALAYLRSALALCRLRGVEPSFLLHPLDFLGPEDAPELKFFPGMGLPLAHKLDIAERFIELYCRHFEVVPLAEHARRITARGNLRRIESGGGGVTARRVKAPAATP